MEVFVIAKSEVGKVKEIVSKLKRINEVESLYVITGEYDILIKLNVETEKAIDVVMDKILTVGGIRETRTIFGKRII